MIELEIFKKNADDQLEINFDVILLVTNEEFVKTIKRNIDQFSKRVHFATWESEYGKFGRFIIISAGLATIIFYRKNELDEEVTITND